MNQRKLVLIGGGGHARACADVIMSGSKFVIAGIIERQGAQAQDDMASNGIRVIGYDNDLEKFAAEGFLFHIAIGHTGDPSKRMVLFHKLKELSASIPSIVSPFAKVGRHVAIGAGSIIMHGAIVNCEAKVGENCIINSGAIVEHHCVVDSHAHIASGAISGGGVHIGRGVLVGVGATILPGIEIAAQTIIGAGAVVTKSIHSPGVYVGVPAKRVKKVRLK